MAVEFSTREYFAAHGKAPRGTGSWAFCPRHRYNASNYLEHVFWAPPGLTFPQAKKAAKEHYQALKPGHDWSIVVCS